MGTPVATLGGVPLLAVGPVSWPQVTGTGAPAQIFHVHDSAWDRMKALLGKPVTLSVTSDTAPPWTWEKLYPLREVPTSFPKHRGVLVTDVRWKWAREIMVRSMNIPRRTGNRRLVAGSIIELKVPYDIYGYAAASLDDETDKYTARRALVDALDELSAKCGHPYEIRGLSLQDTPEVTIEGLETAESFDTALAKLLRGIPQAEITVDRTGKAVVFDATDQEAVAEALQNHPPTQLGEIDRLVDLAPIRPGAIHVYFGKTVEIRFESEEETEASDTITVPADYLDRPTPTMRNVVPLPDPYTTIDGDDVPQGTWVDIRKAVAAWNDDLASIARGGRTPPALTMANIRKYWFVLEAVYTALGRLTLNADEASWTSRIATIRAHYRQTYQIHEGWMQRIRDLLPIRIGSTDPVTGTRAFAQAWSQYCVEPTEKAYVIAALQNNPDLQFYWLNVDNYPGYDNELWDKPASPARVSVVDKDLGILHVTYDTGPYGTKAQIHPSQMKENGSGKLQAPTRDLRDALQGVIATDGHVKGAVPMGLADDFRLAIVVSAMPFSPNDEGRMYRYTVNPSEIKGYLSRHFEVAGGSGPDWHVVVPPSLCTAWYAIRNSSDARDGAELLFGIAGQVGEDRNDAPGYEVINATQTPGPALIPAMARAVAVAQWAAFVNQREGTRTIHLQPGLETVGSMSSVTHSLAPDGRLLTTVSMPRERRPIDITALIAPYARPLILGTIPDIHA